MRYAVVFNYYFGFVFQIKGKQGVNNCFKSLISSVFTTVAIRLKSEQKDKETLISKPNTISTDATPFKLINLNIKMLQLVRIE